MKSLVMQTCQNDLSLYTVLSVCHTVATSDNLMKSKKKLISQIRYSLVVIFALNSVPGVQYKDVMMESINKNN